MKRLLCVLSICLYSLLWIIQLQAQTKEVFPTKNATWEVLIPAPDYTPPLKGNERGDAYLTYTVGTDSILSSNGLKYYDLLVDSLYAGSIRTEGQKVWITFDKGDHETLLYDFGVKVGDTIRQENLQYFFDTPLYIKYGRTERVYFFWKEIYSSDRTELRVEEVKKGIYGKEITVITKNYFFPDTWCEGIGSLYGMFLGKIKILIGSNAYGGCLWKQNIDGIRNYPEQDYGNIQNQIGPTEIQQIKQDKHSFSYALASKNLQIIIKDNANEYKLEVYPPNGMCILRKNLVYGENSISFSSLSSGIYICKLRKDNQIITTQKIQL